MIVRDYSNSQFEIRNSQSLLPDTASFLETLDSDVARKLFASGELVVTRAPGRLDVMGGIADYSGSLVLQLPIANAAHVALQLNKESVLRIASLPRNPEDAIRDFAMPMEELASLNYHDARQRFSGDVEHHWVAYAAGAFVVLAIERGWEFVDGASILIKSDVPEGKGVSSSAALEVAVMQAIVAAYRIPISAQALALLCQKVENLVAGAPCGVMDQMTAACGEADHLLELLCQPCDLKGTIGLPSNLQLWGIDSGIRHSVGGSDYGTVRTAAFMGYRIISELGGMMVRESPFPGKVMVDDPKWNGYLANITPEEFARNYEINLPETMVGRDFLKRFGGITDQVTSVNAEVEYPIRNSTRHPVLENYRVQSFANLLRDRSGDGFGPQLGELMFQSHESYSACGLGSTGTDLLVSLVRESAALGLYGARITGGGSGGTVAVLGRPGSGEAVNAVVLSYRNETKYEPLVISGSSPGANIFGHLKFMR